VSFVFKKGFQFNDGTRMAIKTEDHPVRYMEWSGTIESGYGAGTVKLVDKGNCSVREEGKGFVLTLTEGSRSGDYWFRRWKDAWLVTKVG